METYVGKVSTCYYQRGFGFITPYMFKAKSGATNSRQDIFFHFSHYEEDKMPEKGKIVQFKLSRNNEGPIATDIKEREKQRLTLEIRAS